MISMDTLLSLLTLNQELEVNEFVTALLATPQLTTLCDKNPALKKLLHKQYPRIKAEIHHQLKTTPVPDHLMNEFQLYSEVNNHSSAEFSKRWPDIKQKMRSLHSPFTENASNLIENSENNQISQSQYALFMQRWKLNLCAQAQQLNQALLEQQRDRLIEELCKQIIFTKQLSPLLGDDGSVGGHLWDRSKATLKPDQYSQLSEYANFLIHHPRLIELAEKLGRSREHIANKSDQIPTEDLKIPVLLPDNVKEEIQGIYQSNDMLRMLPAELAVLGSQELELAFYRKLIERQLMTYQLKGKSQKLQSEPHPVSVNNHNHQPGGPFIVCVDTSGSMGGFNERCAKAFCLALLRIALRDQRSCYIILFTSEVIFYELTDNNGIENALHFLSQQFRGGTDLAKCLNAVTEKMSNAEWKEADTVILSDFIAQRLPQTLIDTIRQLQKDNHRFHAVTLSAHGKPSTMTIFDYIWPFDTRLKTRILDHFNH